MAADVLGSVLIGLVLLVSRVSAQSAGIGLSQTNLIIIIAACFATILILGGLAVTWYFWSKRRKARELEKKADHDKNMMLHLRSQYAGGQPPHHAAVSHIGMPMHMAPQQAQWRWMPTELKAEQSAAFKIFSQPTVHTREREYPKIHHPSPKQHRRQPSPKSSPKAERRTPSPHSPRSPSPNRLQVPSVVVQSPAVDYPMSDDSHHLVPPPPTSPTTFPIFRPVTQPPPAANIPVPPPPPPIQTPAAPPPPPIPQAPLPPAVFDVTNVPPKKKTTHPAPQRSPSPKPERKSEPTPQKMLKAAGPRPGPSEPSPPRSQSPRPVRPAPQSPSSPKPAPKVITPAPKTEAPPSPKPTPKPVQQTQPVAPAAPKNVPPPPPIPTAMKKAHPTPQPLQQTKKPQPTKTQPAKPQSTKPQPVKEKTRPSKAAPQPAKPKQKAQGKQKPKSRIPPKKVDLVIQCEEEEIDKAMMPLKAADMKIDLSIFDPKEGASQEPEEEEAVTSDIELTEEAERRVAALFDDIFTDERYTGGLALTSDSEDGAEDSPTRKSARYDDNWGLLDTSHSGKVKKKSTS